MNVTIKTRIGGQLIECSAGNLLEAIALASPLAEMPTVCSCNSTDIALQHRVAKGYHFYGLRCRSCGREFALGQRKEPAGELFPKGPWEHPRRGDSANHSHDEPEPYAPDNDDFIPYDPDLDNPNANRGHSAVANAGYNERGSRPGN
jgi:hypothetical protein